MRFPKPEKRGRAPRKPIARKRRPSAQRRTKRAAAKRSLAYLWRVAVRAKFNGTCIAWFGVTEWNCGGPIQAAHCFGTDEAPGVRLALWNGEPLCAKHHEYFERRKGEWRDYLIKQWGPYLFSERLRLARSAVKVDLEAARKELEGAA